jgi:N-acetylmuramoyl-L-alanine amidase
LVALRGEVLDAEGFRVPDSLRLAVHASGLRPRDTVLVARGEAWAYFRADSAPPRRGAPKRRPGAGLSVTLLDSLPGVPRVAAAAARMELPPRPAGKRLWAGFLAGYPDTLALRGAELAEPVLAPPRERGLSPDGFYWTALDDSGRCDPPALLGYRPVPGSGTPVPLSWSARFGGALRGQRIVLDPEGGGEDAAGLGPTGTRGASLNLEVARALAGYLRSAGARVLLTREGDYALSEVERVQRAEGFLPHRVLRIGHRAEAPRLGYYFASAVGKRWAARAAAWLGRLGVAAPPAVEDAQYVLQQTSCPALYVSALPLGTGEGETRLLEPGFLRREAYALLVALAEDLRAEPVAWPADSLALAESGGAPAARALVAVGGLLHQADSGGVVRFARTEPGALEVQAVPPRGPAPLGVLLESSRGSRIVLPPPGP